ncbi:HNH endonuclease [Sphingomonas sp. Leaf17]|uniref:HNH endonuclease n=1 Tax=Sphingomonas sp. Leaf17 TaxID=1735683 RepID=UPI001F26FB3A|nr:HNH endonuclease [Sphingomonas sp. Leaf17]
MVQRIEWEAAHGPIPEGYALKCLNGDRLDTSPANWSPVSRGVLARLNGGRHRKTLAYDDASPELRPAVMALAKIRQRASECQPNAPNRGLSTRRIQSPDRKEHDRDH